MNFLQGLDASRLLLTLVPILVCLTVHELAHGLAALALGDDTAKRMGRITLNPIRHIDPVGALMIFFVGFGWAKPVMVDMNRFENPKVGMAITALAGPMSNFLLAALILVFQVPLGLMFMDGIRISVEAGNLEWILAQTAQISVFLGVFNLLPIPPLDGSKIVFSFLRDRHYDLLMQYERYGFFLLVILIFWGGLTTGPLMTAMNTVLGSIFEVTRGLSVFLFG